MSTIWEHHVFVVGESSFMPAAISAIDIAFPRDDKEPRNQSKPLEIANPLSANGQLPTTHYGAAFSVTETIRENLEEMGLAETPGIIYWRCSNPEGILVTTNHPASQASIGQPWDWQQCLTAVGLQTVQVELA